MEKEKKKNDLDHDQDQTEEMVKAVNPDKEFMDQKHLCTKCHGPKRICERDDCPQK